MEISMAGIGIMLSFVEYCKRLEVYFESTWLMAASVSASLLDLAPDGCKMSA